MQMVVFCALAARGSAALGDVPFIAFRPNSGAFALVENKTAAPLVVDATDWLGVRRAAGDLQADIERVSAMKPSLTNTAPVGQKTAVLIGTLGHSPLLDGLVRSGKLDTVAIAGRWEAFVIQLVENPQPGLDRALVIAGSDKRGTIYGIYELSEQIGVSPWYWWADVPVPRHEALYIKPARLIETGPAVRYRGIFLNDEAPALTGWAKEKFGGLNSAFYAKVFELLLRLRANYLWPAMWSNAFNEDDPANALLADDYGIAMGTSHHEPMIRAQQEWKHHGTGAWNYSTNSDVLKKFWADGIRRNRNFESIVTIGMRGDGDEPMTKGGDMKANIALLERIVADQRALLASINPDVTKVPQLWALYKEVADYYEHGMKVPDDITLLWCDDNWGNIRRLPTEKERARLGGAGVYYHFDYVGTPRSYKWLNTNPLPKIWEQMDLAFDYGADRIWIVNVGDLKPMEIPIEFFMRMAWDPKAMPKEKIADFTRHWAEREFGPAHAAEIADIVAKYAKYNGWRKPELLEPKTFSLVNYQEAERVLEVWRTLTAQAEKIYAQLSPEMHDAFYQLVLYPTKASATVVELYIATGQNRLYATQGRASANDRAQRVRELFKQDQELSDAYHQLGGGRWNHMMDQPHIGYTNWRDPKTNIMPELAKLKIAPGALMGVAIEGSDAAWPGNAKAPKLSTFDSINQQRHWIDVFRRGAESFDFKISADQPWVKLNVASGSVDQDQRVWVSIDWNDIPVGENSAVVTVSRAGVENVQIQMNAIRSDKFTRQNVRAFGGLTGPTAIAAESATRGTVVGGVRWERIPDYGCGASGVSIFPTTAAIALPPKKSPRLEYPIFIPNAGEVLVDLITGPSLNIQPDRGVRIAVSFDDQPPQIVDAFADQSYADSSKRGDTSSPPIQDWGKWVKDNARTLRSTHKIEKAGVHTLKVWMVDPGVVLEKLVVYTGDLPPSYFGPLEKPLNGSDLDLKAIPVATMPTPSASR